MRRLFTKRWFWIAAGLLVISCLSILVVCWHYRIWSYSDYELYQEIRRYPIGEDLWFGRIRAGDDLEAFTAKYPPHRTVHYGRFTWMEYCMGGPPSHGIPMHSLKVVAKDGRLAGCGYIRGTWSRWFFRMSPVDEEEFDRAYRSQRDRGKGPE